MIVTQFGIEVEIVASQFENGTVDIKRLDGHIMKKYPIICLKADNGVVEINEAINNLPAEMRRKRRTPGNWDRSRKK